MHAKPTIAPTLIPSIAHGLNFEELSLLPPATETAVVLLLPSVALAMGIDVGDKEAEVFVDFEVRDDEVVTEISTDCSGRGLEMSPLWAHLNLAFRLLSCRNNAREKWSSCI